MGNGFVSMCVCVGGGGAVRAIDGVYMLLRALFLVLHAFYHFHTPASCKM